MQNELAKTGFLVSVISYGSFWLLDAIRPGIVARYFSVHIFLLCALIFGAWWVRADESFEDLPRLHVLVATGLGIMFAIFVWIAGEGFESLRILATLVSSMIPLLVLRLVKYK